MEGAFESGKTRRYCRTSCPFYDMRRRSRRAAALRRNARGSRLRAGYLSAMKVVGCARQTQPGRDVALRFLTQVADASCAHGRFEIPPAARCYSTEVCE